MRLGLLRQPEGQARYFGGNSGTVGPISGECDAGSEVAAVTRWVTPAVSGGGITHGGTPHGPSQMAPIAMQWLDAMARGAERLHTTATMTATSTRQCFTGG